ncbi:alpha/beta hydrolase [Nocardioides mangrovi]|uniref:Alpha/beta hydrolase n=1 Tax=Nocardioides mangrovi TaxID=2874580 RepID=A0ABS7UCZ9_9ACTN|nr:alpha/beta hydrolase [Nocardioides mangrovi]MBZ5738879.1 alpha/beta hydrolase [Nocardioides mangrovi]
MSSLSSPSRRPSRLAAALAALVATLSLGLGSLTVAAAPATAERAHAKPTIVLVHGAFADASGFSKEVGLLEAAGYPVIAPADPLRGLTADADYIRSVLATIDGPVVLVGHSYGGAVITNAARGADNVVALVYLAAFIPDEGTSVATSYDPATYPGSLLSPDALVVRPVANPAAPGGSDADLYIRPDLFRKIFAGDQDKATAAAMAATQRPLSAFAYTEPSGEPAWATLPSWDLLTTKDKAISPGGQRFMAERAGAHIRAIRSAHDVMVSHPKAVVSLIVKAATTVG